MSWDNLNDQDYSWPAPKQTQKYCDSVYNLVSELMCPYEGFKMHPVYDDFTVPTFDGKHNLNKGGSRISSGNLTDRKSCYAF